MNRRLFFLLIFNVLLGEFPLNAQDLPSHELSSITVEDHTVRQSNADTISFCNTLKSAWKNVWNNKCVHSDVGETDSIKILKDSITILNNTISDLRQQQNKQNVDNLQSEIISMRKELSRLNEVLSSQIVSTFGSRLKGDTANNFFCFAVMESPLYYRYNKSRIDNSLNAAKAMGYDMPTHKYNKIFNIYYDLLKNYETYNTELIQNIDAIIEQFSYGKPNREFERNLFEDRLSASEYYKVRDKGEYNEFRHIYYLDYEIARVRELFKNDASFKKAKFEEVRKELLPKE